MLVSNLGQAFLALDVVADQIHRPGSIKRDQRDDIVDFPHIELLRRARHSTGFHLEETDRFAAVVKIERGLIVEWNAFEREFRLAFPNKRERVFDHGQCFQAKEIHLQQSEIVERAHRVLADDVVAFYIAAQRDVFGQIAIGDDDTSGVHASVARKTFENLSILKKLFGFPLRRDRALQLRVFLNRCLERDVQLVWNHLRDAIGGLIAQSHDAADIAHDTFRLQFSKGDDLGDAALTVFLSNILEHFATARLAKIDINIRRRDAVRVKEAFED